TTVVAAPRLTAAAKGKQPARATSPTGPTEVERTEAEQLKIVLRRSRHETHISQHGGFSTDEGTGSKPGVPDIPSDDSEEEISWNSSDDEDVDAQDTDIDDDEGKKNDESDDGKDDDDDDDNDDEEEIAKIDKPKDTESGGIETPENDAILPIELTNDDIRNTKAYKEYYAYTTGEAAPKPKASDRRKRGGSDSSTTPPTPIATPTPITTVVAAPRLTTTAKGKQPARATSPTDPSDQGGSNTDEGTGSKPRVPDVPSDDSEEDISWNSSDDEDVDDQTKGRDDNEDDAEKDNDDDDDEEEISKIDEQEATESGQGNDEETKSDRGSEEEETREEAEESFDPISRTPEDSEDDGNGEEDQGLRISEEESIHEEEEADELYRDVDINQGRGLQVSQDIEDSHVTLTPVYSDGQQESSSTSSFVTSLLNPIIDPGMESIFMIASSFVAPLPSPTSIMTLSIITTTITASQPPIPPTPIPSEFLQNLPTFESVFRFEDRVKSLEVNFSEFMRTNQSPEAVSNISVEAYEADKTILDSYGESAILKRRREDNDDQEGPSAGLDQGSKRQRKGGEHASASTPSEPATRSVGRSTTGTQSKQLFASESTFAEEPVQTTCQMEEPSHSVFEIAGPTYELMRGSCNSLTKLEYHLEEVYKATTDQLDWVNPEGQQIPHNLLQPLPLILDNRGRRVILFEHFINNDLEYLREGASSQKYTTSVTKTKATDYGNIKWIEDLVPRTMWIQSLNYDKHALWGVSHWGRKCQQFYGFVVNRESALDVYSKRRIIAVTDLKIVEWHNYKHLD
nr:hypothetical protein [Tanacetum cinerariifolium]